jgi:steroid delta-isomerase-like uncharacterized protein
MGVVIASREARGRRKSLMSADKNKTVVRRYFEEAWNKKNLDVVDEIIAPDLLDHEVDGSGQKSGPGDVKRYLTGYYHKALPDVRMTVEDQVAEGDKVVTRITVRGTHQGELLGVPATGKRIEVTGISVDRIEGGKIVEGWVSWDRLGLLRQLGAVPKPDQDRNPSL